MKHGGSFVPGLLGALVFMAVVWLISMLIGWATDQIVTPAVLGGAVIFATSLIRLQLVQNFEVEKQKVQLDHADKVQDKQIGHETSLEDHRASLAIATSSHMAELLYGRLVEFADEYLAQVNSAIDEVTGSGLQYEHLSITQDLYKLRRKYALYISTDTNTVLSKWEQKITEGAAADRAAKAYDHVSKAEQRNKFLELNWQRTREVISSGLDKDGNEIDSDRMDVAIVRALKQAIFSVEISDMAQLTIGKTLERLRKEDQSP